MPRLFCLGLAVALAVYFPLLAEKLDTHLVNIVPEPPQNDDLLYPPPFTNSIGMTFVWIKPGSFMMGSPKVEAARRDDEVQHKVTLTKGFYLGIHLVTQEQWQVLMGNNPSNFQGEKNLPVDNVSWNDCQEFVKKLRTKDKKPYRLPSEAEWEYACRALRTTPFHFGETISTNQANYDGNFAYGNGGRGVFRWKTTPVDRFPANAWGLHDMHGNLWECCQDWYGDYPRKNQVDPQGPNAGRCRVLRGGSWRAFLRTAARPAVTCACRTAPASTTGCGCASSRTDYLKKTKKSSL